MNNYENLKHMPEPMQALAELSVYTVELYSNIFPKAIDELCARVNRGQPINEDCSKNSLAVAAVLGATSAVVIGLGAYKAYKATKAMTNGAYFAAKSIGDMGVNVVNFVANYSKDKPRV